MFTHLTAYVHRNFMRFILVIYEPKSILDFFKNKKRLINQLSLQTPINNSFKVI